jgi:hypothetical protein
MKRMAHLLAALASTVVLQFGVLPGFSQSYLFTGAETIITLNPGTYDITAFGAQGGPSPAGYCGGLGAEMEAEYSFTTATTLTILVGGAGSSGVAGRGGYGGGGGGGGSFVVNGSIPLLVAGGGGGAGGGGIHNNGGSGLTSSSGGNGNAGSSGGNGGSGGSGSFGGGGGGYYSSGGGGGSGSLSGGSSFLDGGLGETGYTSVNGGLSGAGGNGGFGGGGAGGVGSGGGAGGYSGGGGGVNGGGGGGGSYIDSSAKTNLAEVSGIASPDDPANGEIIITAVIPPLAISTGAGVGFTNGVFGFDVSGPSGSNVIIQASTDLQTWIPLQTNLLGSGPLYFSDSQSTTNVQRFYRALLMP